MKKTVLLLSSILVSVPTFAYGYGSDLDDSLTWIGVLFFVWGILEIILFFKIWGATNDIDKLKSAICDGKKGNGMSSYLKKMYLLGKEDEAYNYLNEAFSDEIVRIHTKCLKESNADGEIVYNGVYEPIETAFNKMINITTDEYLQYYQSIGKEIPSRFKSISFEIMNRY
ncbi:MAG: hypothetical protein IKK07_02415 [Bacteroides sp.]|nr:hypothetical protein [Bacteroides sp.]